MRLVLFVSSTMSNRLWVIILSFSNILNISYISTVTINIVSDNLFEKGNQLLLHMDVKVKF